MSKIIQKFAFLMLFVTTLVMFSCAKEVVGPVGPAGSAGLNGINGAPGATGPAGSNGTPGKDGNANVQGRVFVANASDWVKTFYGTSTTSYYYRAIFLVPEITKAVLDKGLVMVYRSNSNLNANAYIALPYTDSYQIGTTTYVSTYTPVHTEGGISIWKEESDGLPIVPAAGYSFKVVVITPQGKAANPDMNWNNYAEVVKAFDLE